MKEYDEQRKAGIEPSVFSVEQLKNMNIAPDAWNLIQKIEVNNN